MSLEQFCALQVPEIHECLNHLSERQLQRMTEVVGAACEKIKADLQELEVVSRILQAMAPSMKRAVDEARARLLKLSQLQYRLIKYQSWKANLGPLPCFDGQMNGAARHHEKELLRAMEDAVGTP